MPPDNDFSRLTHILDAAAEAVAHAGQYTQEEVLASVPLRRLMAHNLLIIGEAASKLSVELRSEHSDIPWQKMIALRNRIVHAYFGVDDEILLQTVVLLLPDLIRRLQPIRDSLDSQNR